MITVVLNATLFCSYLFCFREFFDNCYIHLGLKSVNMHRRRYRPASIQRHQSSVDTFVETYRKRVDPTASDEDGRNAVHLSVLLAVHDSCVDSNAAAEDALDQVCS